VVVVARLDVLPVSTRLSIALLTSTHSKLRLFIEFFCIDFDENHTARMGSGLIADIARYRASVLMISITTCIQPRLLDMLVAR
jgi:hypothetical protein